MESSTRRRRRFRHQAFDRLEVADFSALSLIDTMNVGPLVPIGEDEVKALEEKFLSH
jgi:hypothetical protein